MWIASTNGFISIVQHWDKPDTLLVRARVRKDLLSIFSELRIIEIPNADYRFRVLVSKNEFAELMFNQVMGIDYPNFKNRIATSDSQKDKLDIYHQIWSIMFNYAKRLRYGKSQL
ncbi:MAG: hypothetical protein EA341_18780 [Mongoliibacter sp.]|uniref:hypothetical protein n=1 Tax=Mongoliibacter sp. TaxID=2022438 RepID=UPI0012F1F360|nr:hypothetical protein [Mongoliibacter sp.]TVP43073.1 MAG: hypothetical protein EA341_18780 [Mongoliibacter sp.]